MLASDLNQIEIFESIKQKLELCADGTNLSLIAYGHTGSGKTYTMFGKEDGLI